MKTEDMFKWKLNKSLVFAFGRLIILLYYLLVWLNGLAQYPGIIKYEGNDNAAIQDLKGALKSRSTGTISITRVPLGSRTGQEFYLAVNETHTTINYTTQNSLENAVYTYLDLLGFRWYGPGDNWFVAPKVLKHLSIAGGWREPSFRNRYFFGTGGLDFGSVQSYDP